MFACHQRFSEQGRDWLHEKLVQLRGEEDVEHAQNEEPQLILDVFGVDQYGRMLVDVRGVKRGETTMDNERWTLATECVTAGWAYPTPMHIMPLQMPIATPVKTVLGRGVCKRTSSHLEYKIHKTLRYTTW